VTAEAPQPNYARRQKLVVFVLTAVGAFIGFIGLFLVVAVLGGRDWALLGAAVVGTAGGASVGWWFALRHDSRLPLRRGVVLVCVSSLVLCTPMLVLFYPLAWPAAGLAGLATLQFLQRSAEG